MQPHLYAGQPTMLLAPTNTTLGPLAYSPNTTAAHVLMGGVARHLHAWTGAPVGEAEEGRRKRRREEEESR